MRQAVFLDRDGVLNESNPQTGASPRTAAEFTFIEAAVLGAQRLHDAGYALVVVTNQPDIGRGSMAVAELDEMHRRLRLAVPIDDIRVCPHDGADGCLCRKPRDGMLRDAAEQMDIDLGRSWMVGDRWVDIVAGRSAGTKTVLIDRPYSMLATSSGLPPTGLVATATAADLREAADVILQLAADG
jgi:D-glycero-D-manno-heptose 1,7-bisphosphate phosphatase